MKKPKHFYNQYLDKHIILHDYEELCPCCHGSGKYTDHRFGIFKCPGCYGVGKIDWIDKIKGRAEKRVSDFYCRCGPFWT